MKHTTKRILAILFISVLVVALLCACGKKPVETTPPDSAGESTGIIGDPTQQTTADVTDDPTGDTADGPTVDTTADPEPGATTRPTTKPTDPEPGATTEPTTKPTDPEPGATTEPTTKPTDPEPGATTEPTTKPTDPEPGATTEPTTKPTDPEPGATTEPTTKPTPEETAPPYIDGPDDPFAEQLPGEDGPTSPTTDPTTPPNRVTGVAINYMRYSMELGDTKKLTAIITPEDVINPSVTWSSNNPSVASVSSSGKVTAHKVGAATISVKTADGGYVATCLISVTAEPLTASAEHELFFRNGIATFEVSITATGGTESYTYSTKVYRNNVLVDIMNGAYFKYTPQSGNYKVEITVTDSGGNQVTLDPILIQ